MELRAPLPQHPSCLRGTVWKVTLKERKQQLREGTLPALGGPHGVTDTPLARRSPVTGGPTWAPRVFPSGHHAPGAHLAASLVCLEEGAVDVRVPADLCPEVLMLCLGVSAPAVPRVTTAALSRAGRPFLCKCSHTRSPWRCDFIVKATVWWDWDLEYVLPLHCDPGATDVLSLAVPYELGGTC